MPGQQRAHENACDAMTGADIAYQVNKPIDGSKYVCLGPGKICEGGEYTGGGGAHPYCEVSSSPETHRVTHCDAMCGPDTSCAAQYPTNPSGFILFVILVFITILFTRVKDMLTVRILCL